MHGGASMRSIPVMGWSMVASASLVSPPFSQRACQKWPPSPLCRKSMYASQMVMSAGVVLVWSF